MQNENSEHRTLSEKVFLKSIALSVCGMIVCMIALCSVTWAWFTVDVSSTSNSIKTAYCDVTVSVECGGTAVTPTDGKYLFEKDKTYEIKISAAGTAGTAYCIVKAGGNSYYTQQFAVGSDPAEVCMAFTLAFSADTPDVEFVSCWGTSSKTERSFCNGGSYLDAVAVTP